MAIQVLLTTRHTTPEVIPEGTVAVAHMAVVLLPVQAVAEADQLSVLTRVAEDNV